MNLDEVVPKLKEDGVQKMLVLIAIEGFGGSGKTTLVEQLNDALQDAYIIKH